MNKYTPYEILNTSNDIENIPDDIENTLNTTENIPNATENAPNATENAENIPNATENATNDTANGAEIFEEANKRLKVMYENDYTKVNMLSDDLLIRAIVAWPHVLREVKDGIRENMDPWDMVWYAPGAWMESAMIPRDMERVVMQAVIKNHLVYPDGTIPADVRSLLVKKGMKMAGIKEEKKEKKIKKKVKGRGRRT